MSEERPKEAEIVQGLLKRYEARRWEDIERLVDPRFFAAMLRANPHYRAR